MQRAFATTLSMVIRWPANDLLSRKDASSSTVGVTSIVRNSVTCGAVNALRTMASAVALRMPLIGVRVSRAAASVARCAAVATGRGVDCWADCGVECGVECEVEPGASTVDVAASTSARVIVPSSPVPARKARFTPRSLASLRTGGVDRGVSCESLAGGGSSGWTRGAGAVDAFLRFGRTPPSTGGP